MHYHYNAPRPYFLISSHTPQTSHTSHTSYTPHILLKPEQLLTLFLL
ncbi:MAG: hypothetical protein F6K40_21775 [Okeania sp. SIO3I5]|nr:hypothetical protein [Okeania sp. SIO3I5]NEQ38755.1 hypothetical protein [Okeania sp. SIO3I5]